MSDTKNSKRESLHRLEQALAEDILNMTDAEILADAIENETDPTITVKHLRDVYKKALTEAGKSRLAAAKADAQIARDDRQSRTITSFDPLSARARLKATLNQHPETRSKLTIAARRGEELSDSDVRSMLDDLEELGILPPDDNKGGDT